ncbi:MAG: adenylate/guanylate cyclase domain-containing protein [Acidobacteria bacterium]|nr:MAG: adenylate/guanylate cyclase domain-containing protein [Acidobacteriota bacterium]
MVFEPPTTQYAKVGDLHIAFQVVGDGPLDLVFVPGWVSNVELGWEEPRQASFLRGLASFARLILFDKRGTGLSDPVPIDRPPTLEDRMADVNAVMDAANVDRAALFGFSEGGAMSALFGATYPDRISSLVLWGATPRISWADDWPWGVTRSEGIAQLKSVESGQFNEHFGLDFFVPGVADEPDMVRWWNRTSRLSASPGMYVALIKANGATDVRSVLPTISVPTLILHRSDDTVVDVRASRYMAEHIPGARLVELPGGDHWPWIGDSDAALGEIQQFLVGSRPEPQIDRFLTTVLFTDIVDSTVKADELGDRAWTKLLDIHDGFSKDQLALFGGKWVKSTGDGMLATFDGPGRAIQCAMSLLERARDHGLELRAGLHTGEAERRGDDIAGMAVHIAARVSALAGANEVLVTSTVRDLVAGSGVRFEDRERITLKGVPGEWLLLAVSG